ncbi:HAD-IA family hydrolase [Bradyrhizobium canariense]|uniref:HAD-IA family hydrolase n=1 Tax=Bradyrhizobium canariense TaxID=255045 RepID=UPI00308317EA
MMRQKPRGVAKGALTWRWPCAEDADPLWSAMQRRELSERALADSQPGGRPLVGEDWWDMQTFVRRARGADPMLIIRPEAGRAIRIARGAGRKIAILSNQARPLLRRGVFGASGRCSGVRGNRRCHAHRHPEARPQAYGGVCDALELAPQAFVFVDDQERNIKGAIACGLSTVWFDVRHPQNSYRQAFHMLGLAFRQRSHPCAKSIFSSRTMPAGSGIRWRIPKTCRTIRRGSS